VHTGVVVAGEIGDSKREIVFHGDVLNTASRIQGKSKELGRDIVVSKDVIDKLQEPGRYELEPLGSFELKGKLTEVFLYSVILKKE
jgi:adenylate cyclase